MKKHLIMNCIIMCTFACPGLAQPFPDLSPALEARNNELFEPIVQFIRNHPEECSADAFYFYVGKDTIWIANGPDAMNINLDGAETMVPPLLMTWRMQRRIWDAYKTWLPNYKPRKAD